ncbi:hypothetical protein JXM83_04730 [Candidatus Woesearchaeota archaeon]|nr:hypothetical protein [Candidatus Woesearchaeota archaeon]
MSEKTKTDSKNNKILIILGVLMLSFAFILLFPKLFPSVQVATEEYYFNGFHFQKAGILWYTQIQKSGELFDLPMHYGPQELVKYKFDNETSKAINEFFTSTIGSYKTKDDYALSYITFDPQDNLSNLVLAATELTFKLRQTNRINLIAACTDNSTGSGCEDRLKITCDNTKYPVIYLDAVNTTSEVVVNENCLTIRGNGREILELTDRVLYNFFGIMN